ncbi:MAG: hypothetical protein P1U56_00355 [Saprospiraceae bacterium]|nr:hypothetical protein [Saprospiraceae bacterium]
MKYFVLFSLFFLYLQQKSIAQNVDENKVVTVETFDYNYANGILKEITEDSVIIETINFGRLAFTKKNVRAVHDGVISRYFNHIPNSSVPYFVQTGISNGEANHYYKNYYIFGNEFNFGLTEKLNLTAGFETASLVFDSGNSFPILQFGTKLNLLSERNFHVALSSKYYFNSEGGIFMLSSPVTFGNKRTNFTLSPNYLNYDGSTEYTIFLNASIGLLNKSRFVVDYIRIDDETIVTPVIEVLFRSGFSLSLGAILAEDGSVPNISFSIPFGRWKKGFRKF